MTGIGPPAGGPPAMNNDPSGAANAQPFLDPKTQLNTYIYDYFLKNGQTDLARALLQSELQVSTNPVQTKSSPGRRDVNGQDENMDADLKDDSQKRADGLPTAKIAANCPGDSFLYDWWCLFWDIWNAQRPRNGKAATVASQYLSLTQVSDSRVDVLRFADFVLTATISFQTTASASDDAAGEWDDRHEPV